MRSLFCATGIVPFNPHAIPDYADLADDDSHIDNSQPTLLVEYPPEIFLRN